VLALKQRLAEVTAGHRPAADRLTNTLPTGITALDELIGGIPRGRLTEVIGAMGSGKTTFMQRVVMAVVTSGVWVAYIDATRTLAPRDWVEAADIAGDGFCVIRPPDPARGAWSADVVLRSGGFGLVVLDGAPSLTRAVTVRLTQLAREAESALVAVGGDEQGWRASALGAALRLRVRGGRAGLVVVAESHHVPEVRCAVQVARRVRADPEVPDRRGMARRARR
jgi:RecA/RadA recombinase